jgi:hypothetical protein
VSPVGSEERIRVPKDNAAALADIARDVINRASAGADRAPSEPSSQVGVADESTVAGGASDPAPPLGHHPPGRVGISVPAPATASPPKRGPATSGTAGYQSNSWRQAPAESARSLSFSSGFFTPPPGLDPALKLQADRVRVEGRPFVYGFLLLRVPLDGPLESALARLGVRLLGPHDDHQKVRVPVESLEAVAGLTEVESLGVSLPEQKLSLELADVHAARTDGAAASVATRIPIVINLFEEDGNGSFRRQLEALGATVGEYDPALHFYRAVATGPTIDRIVALDFVLFVELIRSTSPAHDRAPRSSTPI